MTTQRRPLSNGTRSLATALLALHEITGQDCGSLAKPDEDMPLEIPHPADRQRWVDVSMEQNPALLSSRLAADVARANVQVAFGGHLPTVVLNAKLTNQAQDISEAPILRWRLRPRALSIQLERQPDRHHG